jgi:hypothetical protein
MSAAERTYRLLLRAYPAEFRATFGREMQLVFRAQRREPEGRGAPFWARLLWDMLRSAPAEHRDAARVRWERLISTRRGTMKTMGVLAVLVGSLAGASALTEGWAGGMRGGDAHSLLSGGLGLLGAVALVTAGTTLVRRDSRFATVATVSALVCLAAFGIGLLTGSYLSIATNALGIAFPLVLLAFLGIRGRRGPSVRAAGPLLLLLLALPARGSAQAPVASPAAPAAPAVSKDLPLTAAERQPYIGTYDVTLPGGMRTSFIISEKDGVLTGSPGNQDEVRRLVYQGDHVFFVEGVPSFVLIFTLENGRATRFSVRKDDGLGEGVRVQ